MTIIKADGVYLLNNKILRKRLIKSLEKSQNDGKITLRKTLMDAPGFCPLHQDRSFP